MNPSVQMMAIPTEMVPAVQRMIAAFQSGQPVAQPLEYITPATPAKRPWVDVPLLIALSMLAGVFTWLMVIVVPRYEEIFKDFGTRLPEATVRLLGISRFIGGDFGWAVVWALTIAIPIAVARLRPWPTRHPNRSMVISIFLAIFLMAAMCITTYVILVLPLVTLIQSVSGGTGGH